MESVAWQNNSREGLAVESGTATQASIQIVTNHLTFYGPIVLLLIGTIGCLGNLLTFTARRLRNNACAFYFLCATIFEFFSITFGLLSRLATDHLRSHLQHTNAAYCKLRAYLISAMPLIATYCILLSAVDRFMSSSPHARLRSFSRMPVAFRSMLAAIVLGLVSCCHILISYDLRPKCATLPGLYTVFDGMFVVVWLGVLPHVAMLLFGFGTLRNIRRARQRRRSMKFDIGSHANTDGHLIMMLVQVGLSSFLILTRMIYYAYYLLAPPLTGKHRMIGSFFMSLTTLLYYANYVKSFYVYTLSSRLFRSIFQQRANMAVQLVRRKLLTGIYLDTRL